MIVGTRFQLAAYLVLVAVIVGGFFRVQRVADHGQLALNALCNFRADLATRTDATKAYIADIEHGRRRPIPGITLNDLRRSLAGQEATLKSLRPLSC